jgi:hypothetical protein
MTKFSPADHLFKYEVEETEPDDEDMVELHVVQADDVKREKGTRRHFSVNDSELGAIRNFARRNTYLGNLSM